MRHHLREFLAARATPLEVILGLALVAIGLALISIPAALIVVGVALCAVAIWPQIGRR